MKYFCLLFVLVSTSAISQIRGTVTDEQHNPLPYVSIFFENSYKGTTTNDSGNYELPVSDFGKYVVVFQYLGYKTKKVTVDVKSFPQIVDVVLSEENIGLNEVVINKKDNPANAIIRKA